MKQDPENSGKPNPQAAIERVSTFVAFATRRLHGIESRTQADQVASEVLRLNDAVRRGAHGRIDFRQHPQDFASVLMANADATNAEATDLGTTHAGAAVAGAADAGATERDVTDGRAVNVPPTLGQAGSRIRTEKDSDLLERPILEIAAMLRAGRLSSEQLTTLSVARAKASQPVINAFIAIREEKALQTARARDRELARGLDRGPLHGIVLAHKDCFERAGEPMTVGSIVTGQTPGLRDASLLRSLEEAGAVDIGPLNMNEMVAGPTGRNPLFGDCCNSWDADRISGGSSSGSGAAVGAGVVFGSIGSDTGGSIRLPASMNGLFGMKPTYGRVSRAGCFPRAFSLDCAGPLARSAEDCAVLLQAIAGRDARDPSSLAVPVPDYVAALARAHVGSRIGVLGGLTDFHPEITQAFSAFVEVLARTFGQVMPVESGLFETCYAMADVMSKVEAATLHGDWMRERGNQYSQGVFSRTEPGLHVPAARYLESLQVRAGITQEFIDTCFAEADVLVCPTMPIPVPTRDEADVERPGQVFGVVAAITPLTRPFNYLGLPVLTMPIGCDTNGMPIGAQLVGRPFGEARLLAIAHHASATMGWDRLARRQEVSARKGGGNEFLGVLPVGQRPGNPGKGKVRAKNGLWRAAGRHRD